MDVIRDKDTATGLRIQGHNINNLKFAIDINMIEEDRNKLQESMIEVSLRKAEETVCYRAEDQCLKNKNIGNGKGKQRRANIGGRYQSRKRHRVNISRPIAAAL